MILRDLLSFAVGALRGHPVRTSLCLTGVSIGIVAIVVLTALGEGARSYVVNEFSSIGSNLLIILPGKTETTGAIPGFGGVPHDLTIADSQAIRIQVPALQLVVPISMGTEAVRNGDRSRQVPIVGTTWEFLEVRGLAMEVGEFLPPGDPTRGRPIVVLGKRVARELFLDETPLGKLVRIGEWRMRIIGVLEERGTQLGMDLDDIVIVPVATGMRMFNRHSLFRMLLRVHSVTELDRVCDKVVAIVTERHQEEDITCITQDAVVTSFSSIFSALTLGLGAIGAISLLVAGVGVMNVMLIAVSDRTEEVGLLKALGARDGQILTLFLMEAILLSFLGGILGLMLGWGIVLGLGWVFPNFPLQPPYWVNGTALGVAMVVGIIFGLLPARRAAKLDPVEALEGSQ